MQYLTSDQIAQDLGINKRTVQQYCREGFISATKTIRNRSHSYQIELGAYLEWKKLHFDGVKKGKCNKYNRKTRELSKSEIRAEAKVWLQWCANGQLNGKPFSKRTLELYESYFGYFIDDLPRQAKLPIISVDNLRLVLGKYQPQSYATKQKIYDSIMSLSKYLVETGKLAEQDRDALKKLRPRRSIPARKTVLTQQQLDIVLAYIDSSSGNSTRDKLLSKTLVIFLANTGLRAQELCNLKLKDIDLEIGIVYVWLGKGNKNRRVGINESVVKQLKIYLKQRINSHCDSFFISGLGTPLTKKTLMQKVRRLSKGTGIDITCHGLRRTFASLNSAKGRPLNHLRLALGHTDLSTTQSYIMTSEDEVVEAMKGW
jgi:integrase